MKSITVCIFGMVALLGIVSSADMPQIVYIHYSTPEEAEAAREKILAEYEGATIIMEDDPLLSVLNVTSPELPKIFETTPSETLLDNETTVPVMTTVATSSATPIETTTNDKE